ncbi:MAG: PAS domain S-box protein [Anaerolineales bacterium]|nr:PAS domain S-box protein [Anaerolineales bacterium]
MIVVFALFLGLAALSLALAAQVYPLTSTEFVRLAAGVGVAGLLALAAVGWLGRIWLGRRLRVLADTLDRLGRGDLTARAGLGGADEVAWLGQALDQLAAALEQREAGRREAETQLQASERRYRRLVELSPDAILIRVEDQIVFINLAGARLLGASEPTQVAGRRFGDFVHPASRDRARERLQPAEPESGAAPLELTLARLDGSTFEAEVSVSPLAHGGQPAAQVIIRDITERKQAEAALRESEARFRSMADSAPVLIWTAGLDGLRTFFNKPWLDFTGRRLDQELGMGWTDGLHPDDYQRYLEAYTTAVKTGHSLELEYRLRRADGAYRWLVSIAVPRFTPAGRLAGYIGTCLDLTERHEAEEALRLSRDQFAFILQSAADGITAQDPAGRLRYANEAAARMLGYASAEALLAVPWPEVLQQLEVFDEAGQPFALDQLPGQRALHGVLKAAATVRLRPRSAGEERWLAIQATPVFNEREQIELAVNVFQDITGLRQAGLAQRLLAEAGRLLAAPVDSAAWLADLTRLVVPALADWGALDIVTPEGAVQRVAVAGTAAVQARLAAGHPFEPDAPHGSARSLRLGVSELYPFIPDSLLDAAARDEAHLQALRALDLKSALVVPLLARDRPLGALTLVRVDTRQRYSRADLALAEELARRAALALDNARLYDEAQKLNASLEQRVTTRTTQLQATNARLEREVAEREAAQRRLEDSQAQLRRLSAHLQAALEEERIRIAREIHDELGQALAGLKMDVAWLRRSLGQPAPAVALKLEDMTVLIEATVQAMRRISAELRPSLLDDLGLVAAVEWQLDEFRERTGLECQLTTALQNGPPEADQAAALFRILQEALTNVVRHAAARRVSVTLAEGPQTLTLRIQDDGRGITPAEASQSKSFGLLGMRERVHRLGGEIEVHGRPGQGTTITVQVPLTRRPNHDQSPDR